jgi:hypothetical protein
MESRSKCFNKVRWTQKKGQPGIQFLCRIDLLHQISLVISVARELVVEHAIKIDKKFKKNIPSKVLIF